MPSFAISQRRRSVMSRTVTRMSPPNDVPLASTSRQPSTPRIRTSNSVPTSLRSIAKTETSASSASSGCRNSNMFRPTPSASETPNNRSAATLPHRRSPLVLISTDGVRQRGREVPEITREPARDAGIDHTRSIDRSPTGINTQRDSAGSRAWRGWSRRYVSLSVSVAEAVLRAWSVTLTEKE